MVQRWTFHDPSTGESWTVPMNPNKMTSPHAADGTQYFTASAVVPLTSGWQNGIPRVFQGKKQPHQWQFSGAIREEDHYATMRDWCHKTQRIHVTDHLARTWLIQILSAEFDEKKPTPNRNWRYEYTVKAINLGAVA